MKYHDLKAEAAASSQELEHQEAKPGEAFFCQGCPYKEGCPDKKKKKRDVCQREIEIHLLDN